MNYIPRKAVIVASSHSDGAFAESTVASYGLSVSRSESTASLAGDLESQLAGGDRATAPDIAIVTGSASQIDSQQIDNISQRIPVVVATPEVTVPEAVDLMKQGAKDVVLLPCSPEELWGRLSVTLEAGDAEATRKAVRAEMQARFETLTPAEQEVVEALLEGMANKQIAQKLGIGLRTVELRRSKIMRKMKASSVAELVKFICQSGKIGSLGSPARPTAATEDGKNR